MKNNAPKYSIIVPVYNVELYLKECVDSILSQSFDDYEIILVDDGSSDKCPEICDSYKNKSQKVRVIHQKNGGLSVARNSGVKVARGKYLLFLDSDDYIKRDYLKIIDMNNDDCELLIFGFYDLYKNKIIRNYGKNELLTREQALSFLVSDDKFGGYACNKVFKKEIIDKFNLVFDPDVIMCEDILFSYEYIKHINTIKTIDALIYYYRRRKSSLVSRKIKDINNRPLFETYHYIINDTNDYEVRKKSKALYLKYYYKFRKHISDGVVDDSLVRAIEKNDYKGFSAHDKRLIMVFKFIPVVRTIIYYLKDLKLEKYE